MSRLSQTELEPRWAEMLRYVQFAPADGAFIHAAAPAIEPHLVEIVDHFYDRVHEHNGAHAVLRDEAQVQRLKQSLRNWLAALLRGPYDAAYFSLTEHVGMVHVRVNLPIRYLATGFSVVHQLLSDRVPLTEQREATIIAFGKLLDAELAVMLDAYHTVLGRGAPPVRDSGSTLAYALDTSRVSTLGLSEHGEIVFAYGPLRSAGQRYPAALELFVPGEIAEQVREQLTRLHAGGRLEVEFTTQHIGSGGQPHTMDWRIARSNDPAHEAVYFAYVEDVSFRSENEQKAREAARMASLGTLAAGLAHEIRNPLNGANLHLRLLERTLRNDKAAPELLETVATVSTEIHRLSSLVTEFLQFARPQPIRDELFVMCDVAQRAMSLLEADAAGKNITITFEGPPLPAYVRGEPDKIAQVILNLGRNAMEAAGDGGNIWIRIKKTPKHAVVEVSDDGPGLADPKAPIFDAFYSTKPEGTGLGLSICQRIVADHGGVISVESKPGAMTFRVRLPRVEMHGTNDSDNKGVT